MSVDKIIERKEEKQQKYIEKHLDLDGGALITVDSMGLCNVDYCFRNSKFKIMKVNIVLFFIWLFG